MSEFTATYSPDDNKLRLYTGGRLEPELYQRVKEAGFRWAPHQELFVAPMWTPAREDLLIELAGEIIDEDTNLVDRAEERAERFEDYSDKREADYNQAHAQVKSITDHIPLGQPILVGHHSEKRARKDAERIENGMRRAVKMWETSKYWEQRAKGAIRHAKYKERPEVRARRIKKIEAHTKKLKAEYEPNPKHKPIMSREWDAPEDAEKVLHYLCGQGRAKHYVTQASMDRAREYAAPWIEHNDKRLIYERAMLAESGYVEPEKKRPTQPPLLNYPGMVELDGSWATVDTSLPAHEMTKAEYMKIHSDYRGGQLAGNGSHRVRVAMRRDGSHRYGPVFLTDSKVHERPETQEKVETVILPPIKEPVQRSKPKPVPDDIEAMKETLRHGVKTVSAPQLFTTPPELAKRVVQLAGSMAGRRILEPSAGTGNLIREIIQSASGNDCCKIVAVETNHDLVNHLKEVRNKTLYSNEDNFTIIQKDFLECNGDIGTFDRIIMNPPFKNGEDIKHIQHARKFLKPGGKLVAICANGPRQQAQLKPECEEWIDLPAETFKASGTNVNTAIIVIT